MEIAQVNRPPKGYRRSTRVGEALRQVIAETIERHLDDVRRLGLVTVTEVDAAPDLKTAKVYVSVLGTPDPHAAITALEASAPLIQREIARGVRIMWTPRLSFHLDEGPAHADRISRLLRDAVDSGTKGENA